ncbi:MULTISPECIES: helix-turn-helix transcriptional regulator [Tsukamurella]|uniref:DNA-binding protein n=1 Tax=Tsukamurella strandjordii TaxID=147577 RepID=A0AA90NCF6_9ACTN|nr:DNA-binding protein [Tsukamurella strandjordii]MDP0399220.1 DNA-binding protein [Tsukamurella strandjordii]
MSTQTESSTAASDLSLDGLRSGPPTVSVPRAGQYIGVSKAYAYQMAREGRLPTIRLGERRVRVPVVGLLRLLGAED